MLPGDSDPHDLIHQAAHDEQQPNLQRGLVKHQHDPAGHRCGKTADTEQNSDAAKGASNDPILVATSTVLATVAGDLGVAKEKAEKCWNYYTASFPTPLK